MSKQFKYLKYNCVYCGQHMEYDPQHAGRQLKCPACNHNIALPHTAESINPFASPNEPMTWTEDVPKPDVTTPTRYFKKEDFRPPANPQ